MTCIAWRLRMLIFQILTLVFLSATLLIGTSYCVDDRHTHIFRLLSGKVNVTAVYDFSVRDEGDKHHLPSYYGVVTIYIMRDDTKFEVTYYPISVDPPQEVIDLIRKSTGWKDWYLFVPSSCGTGNAWKCDTEHVFMVKNGKLIKLGSLKGGLDVDTTGPIHIRTGYSMTLTTGWR